MVAVIFSGLIAIGSLGFIIGIPLCIFFAVKASGEPSPDIKKRYKRKAIWSFFGPILLIALPTFLWGIVSVFGAAF